jgi:hypothetical protein
MKGIPETVNKGITRYFDKDGKEMDKETFEELTKKGMARKPAIKTTIDKK